MGIIVLGVAITIGVVLAVLLGLLMRKLMSPRPGRWKWISGAALFGFTAGLLAGGFTMLELFVHH